MRLEWPITVWHWLLTVRISLIPNSCYHFAFCVSNSVAFFVEFIWILLSRLNSTQDIIWPFTCKQQTIIIVVERTIIIMIILNDNLAIKWNIHISKPLNEMVQKYPVNKNKFKIFLLFASVCLQYPQSLHHLQFPMNHYIWATISNWLVLLCMATFHTISHGILMMSQSFM